MIKFSIPIFYIFQHKKSFLVILANFSLSRTLELMFFGPLFLRIYGRHSFSLFQVLAEIWWKWRQILKNTTRAEILKTISTAIRIKNDKNFETYLRAIFYINCYYKFVIITHVVFLRIWRHFLQISAKTWNKENDWRP